MLFSWKRSSFSRISSSKISIDLGEKRLTNLEVLELVTQLSEAIDNSEYTTGVFLDLSLKAFDTVDHDILPYNLKYYGLRGVVLEDTYQVENRLSNISYLRQLHN